MGELILCLVGFWGGVGVKGILSVASSSMGTPPAVAATHVQTGHDDREFRLGRPLGGMWSGLYGRDH